MSEDNSQPSTRSRVASSVRASAIRRILREWQELALCDNDRFRAEPINPEEPYEWHFTIRGPPGSPFEFGIYHGRLVLPGNYPMAPPSLYFFTINGRFEVNKQVCLSATNYHPESWQPAWGIRSILEALHAFLPTPSEGAVHSLEWSDSVRRDLARLSTSFVCSVCGRSNAELISRTAVEMSSKFNQRSDESVAATLDDCPQTNSERHARTSDGNPQTSEAAAVTSSSNFDEQSEYIKRQPNQQSSERMADARFSSSGRLFMFRTFLYWLLFFAGAQIRSRLRSSRLFSQHDYWNWIIPRVEAHSTVSNVLVLLRLGLLSFFITATVWSLFTLWAFAIEALRNTIFLGVPRGADDSSTFFEEFPISPWIAWVIQGI